MHIASGNPASGPEDMIVCVESSEEDLVGEPMENGCRSAPGENSHGKPGDFMLRAHLDWTWISD